MSNISIINYTFMRNKIAIIVIMFLGIAVANGVNDCNWRLSELAVELHNVVESDNFKPCTTFWVRTRLYVFCESQVDHKASLWAVCDSCGEDHGDILLSNCDFGTTWLRKYAFARRETDRQPLGFPFLVGIGMSQTANIIGSVSTHNGIDNTGFIAGRMDGVSFGAIVATLSYRYSLIDRLGLAIGGFGGQGYGIDNKSALTIYGGEFGLYYVVLRDRMIMGVNYYFIVATDDIDDNNKLSSRGITMMFGFE